jgi:hypothetical protein
MPRTGPEDHGRPFRRAWGDQPGARLAVARWAPGASCQRKVITARNFIIPLLLAAVLVNGSGLLVLASHLSRSTGRATRLSPPLPEEKFDRLICSFFNRNLTVGRRDISRCSIRSESATPRAVGMVTSSSCSADRNVRTNRGTLTSGNCAWRTAVCRVASLEES